MSGARLVFYVGVVRMKTGSMIILAEGARTRVKRTIIREREMIQEEVEVVANEKGKMEELCQLTQ